MRRSKIAYFTAILRENYSDFVNDQQLGQEYNNIYCEKEYLLQIKLSIIFFWNIQ